MKLAKVLDDTFYFVLSKIFDKTVARKLKRNVIYQQYYKAQRKPNNKRI